MKHKNVCSYITIYNCLKNFGVDIKSILVDLEQSQFLAIREVFSNVKILVCSFHLNQIFWRHLQKLNLANEYLKNNSFRRVCKKILAVAYLPINILNDGISLLNIEIKLLEDNENMNIMLTFFINNFISFDANSIKYVANWNLFLRISNGEPTTTNSLET
jgi:hypothetical protein